MKIDVSNRDGVVVLAIDNPPVNALSIGQGVVPDLHAAFAAAMADAAVYAVVVTGKGRFFSGGADINDFESSPEKLTGLRDLFEIIENASKPVVAALHGAALGGGLELAMACHYRVASAGTKLGLPEVNLGLLPGAGGTQRLARLVGAGEALSMMLGGKPISAARAKVLGLLDEVTEGDVVEAALDFLAASSRAPRPTGVLPVPADLAQAIADARAAPPIKGRGEAPSSIIDCVAAIGDGDLSNGLAYEARRFAPLMISEASRGLRHAFFAERAVGRIPGLGRDIKPLPIAKVAVVGGGLMGTGITIALLNAGLSVTLIEPRDEARAKAQKTVATTIGRDAEKGRIPPAEAEARIARLTLAGEIEAAAGANLAIEAVFEAMDVKEAVFRKLDTVMGPEGILASNTSTLDLDAIAAFTARPERVVGLHFFSPANVMRLLEVVRGKETAPQVLATALALAAKIGKVGVVSGVCNGFIGNRLFEEYLRQAYQLAEEGALPQQIDAALEAWGFAMGPFRVMDLVGQDVGQLIRKQRAIEQPEKPYSGFPDRLCDLGRFGQKTGKGIYTYPDGRTAAPDPEIDAFLLTWSTEKGITRRKITDDEIVARCVLTMVNEGAKILAEGIAYRPVDIDVVYLSGYGFPAERGGPMFYADRLGLDKALAKISEFAKGREGWAWSPAPLLVDLAGREANFGSLNP